MTKIWPQPEQWGTPPWTPRSGKCEKGWPQEESFDLAVIGAGFTGLTTACEALRQDKKIRVVVLEQGLFGHGASGRTGGVALAGTAAGPIPGFENCLEGLSQFIEREKIPCDLKLGGCWEVGRSDPQQPSPIAWNDDGVLRVQKTVPGGALDPGAFLAGLLRTCRDKGAEVRDGVTVGELREENGWIHLLGKEGKCRARKVALSGDAPLLGLFPGEVYPYQTLAIATGPLSPTLLKEIGWASETPFYTLDLPYLWGRLTSDGKAVIGSGLVAWDNASALADPEPRELMASLEDRVHGLHPALRPVRITHRWAGPIGLTSDFRPRFMWWKDSQNVLAAAGYCGHGVALSVRMGRLLAGALLNRTPLPSLE